MRAALAPFATLVLCAWSPANAGGLRLADVLRRVADEGPQQAVTRASVRVAEADVTTSAMWPNPGLTLSGQGREPVFSAAVSARLPIFGQRGARVRASEGAVRQSEAEAEAARWSLRREARIAYYAVARAEEELRIAEELTVLLGNVAAMAAERYDVGAGTRLEMEQAALLSTRARQDVSDRRAAATTARLELARLIGVPAAELGELADGLDVVGPTATVEELSQRSGALHPELRALTLERDAALLRARSGRADRRPAPTAELGLDVLDPSTCGGPSRCVGPRGALSLDLAVFNLNSGPIERAEAEARVAEAKARAVAVRVDAALRGARTMLDAATARARFFDVDYLPAALRVEGMARAGFTTGKTGLLPLIEAERAMLDARLGRAGAWYAVHAVRADLEEASGVPLSVP